MTEDARLIGFVAVVWVALAALYAFVPLFHMPGSAQVWGAGALIFMALAILIAAAEARARRRLGRESDGTSGHSSELIVQADATPGGAAARLGARRLKRPPGG